MIEVIEAIEKTENKYGEGLKSKLFFGRCGGLKTQLPEVQISNLTIDTHRVKNKKFPYNQTVTDNFGNEIFRDKFTKENMRKGHFDSVNRYKEQYLDQKD